ncbi:glycosyltransferase [Aquicoccus porphyridii]|uniref:glycosyltransferase n=1 Tax=Aquicoccus porphyridii TaxID=1852029 RepID=UPI00273FF30C|nr:glycosyltransferase [Aquicoccus porphyridii]
MNARTEIPVVGVVRFSVLALDYYTERFETVDKVADHLFSPARLALRFELFEKLCLPSLVQQSDRDFRAVVLTSTELPSEARARLDALVAPHDHIEVFAAAPDLHYPITRAAYRSVPLGGASHKLWFRLDDDDAVSRDYVERLKQIGLGLRAVHEDQPFMIAFNRGFYVEVTGQRENDIVDFVERAPLSVGTALLAPATYDRTPYRYNHRALGQHYNLYTDVAAPVFLRTIHSDNKSQPTKQGVGQKLSPSMVERQIHERFGFDIDMLRAL